MFHINKHIGAHRKVKVNNMVLTIDGKKVEMTCIEHDSIKKNETELLFLLNTISIAFRECALWNTDQGYEGCNTQAQNIATEIYKQVKATGFYDGQLS